MEHLIAMKNSAIIILTVGIWGLLITIWLYPGEVTAEGGHTHPAYEIEGLENVTFYKIDELVRKVVEECTVEGKNINC